MITLEKGYELVSKAFPKLTIFRGFRFRDKLVFEIANNDLKDRIGGMTLVEVLDKNETVVTADLDEIFNNLQEYKEAQDKQIVYVN